MQDILKTRKLTRRLEGEVPVTLVENVDIKIRRGEFVVIAGPSGSGKSSLLYLLGLLDTPTSGQIWLNGAETSAHGEDRLADIRRAEIGFVFQFHFLLPEFTALENVMLPMQRCRKFSGFPIRKRAEELLDSLGLAGQMHKLPKQLSGGESQRVAIARALANDPALILADEPTGNLDSASGANVRKILKDLAHQHGRTVAVVSHDAHFAAAADRVITIVDGRIINQ